MNWISVKDQLPENMSLVLIWYSSDIFGNNAFVAAQSLYAEERFHYIDKDKEFCNVSHWIYWSDIPKPQDKDKRYDETGRIERICMRKLCNQPVYVREYIEYDNEHALLCQSCTFAVENLASIAVDKKKLPISFDSLEAYRKLIRDDFVNDGKEGQWLVNIIKSS